MIINNHLKLSALSYSILLALSFNATAVNQVAYDADVDGDILPSMFTKATTRSGVISFQDSEKASMLFDGSAGLAGAKWVLSPEEQAEAAKGYQLTVKARVVEGTNNLFYVTNVGKRFIPWLSRSANGDLIVDLERGSSHVLATGSDADTTHEFEVRFDGSLDMASFFMDGVLIDTWGGRERGGNEFFVGNGSSKGAGKIILEEMHLQLGLPLDTDGDGIPDEVDLDDDNDGLPDERDPNPLVDDSINSPDSDGDSVSDHQELVNGTDPNINNLVPISFSVTEDFTDIEARDNSRLNAAIHAQVTTKSDQMVSLSWTAFNPSSYYDDDYGEGVSGNLKETFLISDMPCTNYQLEISASYSNTLTSNIRVDRGNETILGTIDLVPYPRATKFSAQVSNSSSQEEITVVGYKSWLGDITVSGACEVFDSDLDGISDPVEEHLGFDPQNPDGDDDGINDADEYEHGLNPLDPSDGDGDLDGDGISNKDEIANGDSPYGYKPQVQSLHYKGQTKRGETLSAAYTFFDRDLVDEGNSDIIWKLDGDSRNQAQITLTNADVGKQLQLCVTPRSSRGIPSDGDEVCTDANEVQTSLADWTGLGAQTLYGRTDRKGVDLLILGDGYDAEHMEQFKHAAMENASSLLGFHEIAEHASSWNITAIGTPSNSNYITDSVANPPMVADTVYGSYRTGARYILVNTSHVQSIAADKYPGYDIILLLSHSPNSINDIPGAGYAGVAVAASNPAHYTIPAANRVNVSIHELGHSFANLGDEYVYGGKAPLTADRPEPNISNDPNPETVKWKHWVAPTAHLGEEWYTGGKVGSYEGALYRVHGAYRPTNTSIMSVSYDAKLFSVNAEAWALKIYETQPIASRTLPDTAETFVHYANTAQTFEIDSVYTPEQIEVRWYLNDQLQSENSFIFNLENMPKGKYQLRAELQDVSGLILKDDSGYSSQTITWNGDAR